MGNSISANMEIKTADMICAEYLLYRGYTQSLAALTKEMEKDRLKQFDSVKIVDSIYQLSTQPL